MKLEQAAEALAFRALVLLVVTHAEHKGALETRVHALFTVPAFPVGLALAIEIWVPGQPQLWVLKTWMGLVLSSCLMQLSILMYTLPSGQPWRGEDPTDLTFLTIFFCWHLASGAALLAAIYGLCSLWHDRFSPWRKVPGAKYHL